jgi:hypothetical protein
MNGYPRTYENQGEDRWRVTFHKPNDAAFAEKLDGKRWKEDRQRLWRENEMLLSGFERVER